MKRLLIILLFATLGTYLGAQTLQNPAVIGAASRNQQVAKSLLVKDTVIVKGPIDVTGSARIRSLGAGIVNSNSEGVLSSSSTVTIDTLNAQRLSGGSVQVRRSSFTSELASYNADSTLGGCGLGCDTIQMLLDSLYNSPWTHNGTGQIVQRDTTLNVGIGTTNPTAKLHVNGSLRSDSSEYSITVGKRGFYDGSYLRHQVDADNEMLTGYWYDTDGFAPYYGMVRYYQGSQAQFIQLAPDGIVSFQSLNFSLIDAPNGALFNGTLTITQGDIYINDIGSGIIIPSPDGTCWRLTPDNAGASVWTPITCP